MRAASEFFLAAGLIFFGLVRPPAFQTPNGANLRPLVPVASTNVSSNKSGTGHATRATESIDLPLPRASDPFPRLAAEFEPQKAVLISACELLPDHRDVFVQVIDAARGHVDVGVLVNDRQQLIQVAKILKAEKKELQHVTIYPLRLNTIWLRDFGPRLAQLEQGAVVFDFLYDSKRPKDDQMPRKWSELTGQRYHAIPWRVQGGNLLTNGAGLAITTTRIFQDNPRRLRNRARSLASGPSSTDVQFQRASQRLKSACNLNQLVVLEPLRNEATGHVDMFASFIAADHLIVSQLDRSEDPVNAAVLERNVRKLAEISVGGRPLQVTRIPMPARSGSSWSTFTNVIIANGVVMLPTFNTDDPTVVAKAIQVYRDALPGHQVKTIDTTSLRHLEGSLHCISVSIPEFATMPNAGISAQRAIEKLNDR